jgi:hypothetical protein
LFQTFLKFPARGGVIASHNQGRAQTVPEYTSGILFQKPVDFVCRATPIREHQIEHMFPAWLEVSKADDLT